jgi:hypothetical protein
MGIVCKPVNSRPVAESSTAADSGIYFFAPLEYLALSENTFIGQPDKLFSAEPDRQPNFDCQNGAWQPIGSGISRAMTGLQNSAIAASLVIARVAH